MRPRRACQAPFVRRPRPFVNRFHTLRSPRKYIVWHQCGLSTFRDNCGGTIMKVLLVDDDADLLDVTAYALRREGFNLVMATDGTQAIRRWQADRPDLVVLDVGLPN